jgi:hypothetical protein
VKNSVGRFATATDSEFLVPIYPSTVCNNSYLNVKPTHMSHRPTPPSSLRPLSFLLRTRRLLGQVIHFNQPLRMYSLSDRTVHVSLPLRTSGQPFPISSGTTLISKGGMTPYSAMLPTTMLSRLKDISSMVPAAS